MSLSVNKTILVGHLGRDPEAIAMNEFKNMVRFSVATTETWTDKLTKTKREETEWHNISVFSPQLCDVAIKYLKKGSLVYLEGKSQTSKWIDKEGNSRNTTTIVINTLKMLGGKREPESTEDLIPF